MSRRSDYNSWEFSSFLDKEIPDERLFNGAVKLWCPTCKRNSYTISVPFIRGLHNEDVSGPSMPVWLREDGKFVRRRCPGCFTMISKPNSKLDS